MNSVILQQPRRVLFGAGCVQQAANEFNLAGWRRLFVVTSPGVARMQAPVFEAWRAAGLSVEVFAAVNREPEIALFDEALAAGRAARPHAVIGFGGGSPIDVAKLVAALLDGGQSIREVFGI